MLLVGHGVLFVALVLGRVGSTRIVLVAGDLLIFTGSAFDDA
jgi:hypothetical protein